MKIRVQYKHFYWAYLLEWGRLSPKNSPLKKGIWKGEQRINLMTLPPFNSRLPQF